MSWYRNSRFPRYVPVAERRQKAAREAEKLKKKGQTMQPVIIAGRIIANTFWGKAWCQNLESYSDFENRLPRGRTYVRNGSVIDLSVAAGEIKALVSGSSIYKITISIKPIVLEKWNQLVKECAGKIDSLIELLQGKFSKSIMEIITRAEQGLFPHPDEIKLNCSCPDYAYMCKHIAAVLYGIGARLDEKPEDLFLLRKVDHAELIAHAGKSTLSQITDSATPQTLDHDDLSALFGIDIDGTNDASNQGKTLPKIESSTLNKKEKIAKKRATKKVKSVTKKAIVTNSKKIAKRKKLNNVVKSMHKKVRSVKKVKVKTKKVGKKSKKS